MSEFRHGGARFSARTVSGGGRNYLLAVLTTGDPTGQYGIDTIDQLPAIVWSRMR